MSPSRWPKNTSPSRQLGPSQGVTTCTSRSGRAARTAASGNSPSGGGAPGAAAASPTAASTPPPASVPIATGPVSARGASTALGKGGGEGAGGASGAGSTAGAASLRSTPAGLGALTPGTAGGFRRRAGEGHRERDQPGCASMGRHDARILVDLHPQETARPPPREAPAHYCMGSMGSSPPVPGPMCERPKWPEAT